MKTSWIVCAVIALFGLGLVAGGVAYGHYKNSGERVQAKVTDCHVNTGAHGSDVCSGTWVEGGALVGGNGHVVIGTIDDASFSDIGKTLTVHVHGDHAYTSSLRIPIILIVFGVLSLLYALFLVGFGLRKTRTA
jgi:hypothetical protein